MLAQWYEDYKDRGLMIVTLIVETLEEAPPTVDDLNEWADAYGSTHAVTTDPDWEVIDSYSERGRPALPSFTLIAPGMEILLAAGGSGSVTEEDLLDLLP